MVDEFHPLLMKNEWNPSMMIWYHGLSNNENVKNE